MKRALLLACLLAAGASGTAAAASDTNYITADTLETFRLNAAEVRHEMRAGGRFSTLDDRQRERVEGELQRMENLFLKSGTVEDMSRMEKVELFNAQERVNGLLTASDDERLVCRMVEPTGSKMRKRECKTAGEIRRTRESHREGLRNNTKAIDHGPYN